uniref:Abi family protein n=1 Tax=Lactococcus sp. TaxID=44273 RepID=UPI0034DCFF2D
MKDNEGITISDVIRTYQLDEFIRENLFIFSTRLEIFWKKKIIDTLCAEYQESHLYHVSQCYLDKDLYSGDEWGQKVINDFSSFFIQIKVLILSIITMIKRTIYQFGL